MKGKQTPTNSGLKVMRMNIKWVNIPDVLFFQEGPGVRNTQYTDKGVKLLNVANLVDGKIDLSTSDRYISEEEAYGKYKHFLCDAGDFIIASSGIKVEYIDKKMGFIDESMLPLCMNTSTIRFKVLDKNQLNIRYFMYYLKSHHFKEQLAHHITGSAQLNYGPSHLKKMIMPLSPIDDQEIIIEKLDKLQSIIAHRKQQLLKLDELVKARFVEMFGEPVSNTMNWDTVPLGKLTTKIGSGATPKGGRETYGTEGISLIRSMNVHNGYFEYKDLAYISDEQAKKLDNVIVHDKDVLLNITGASVARCCIVPDNILPARVNQHVCIIRCKADVSSIFLCSVLTDDNFQNLLWNIAGSGATREAITKQQVESLSIIVPPIALQQQFATFVAQIDKSKVVVQKALDEAQLLFDSLMQECFG